MKNATKKQTKKLASKPAAAKRQTGKESPVVQVRIKRHRDSQGNHHHVITEDFEDKHVSVGLSTKKKKGQNSPNYKLETSPLSDGKESYMRRQGTVDKQRNYFDERIGQMTPKDYERAKVYGERAKQKHLKNKKSNDKPNT